MDVGELLELLARECIIHADADHKLNVINQIGGKFGPADDALAIDVLVQMLELLLDIIQVLAWNRLCLEARVMMK